MTTNSAIDILSAHIAELRDDAPLMAFLTKVTAFEKLLFSQCNRVIGAESDSAASNDAPKVRDEVAGLIENILKTAGLRQVLNSITEILTDVDRIEKNNYLPQFRTLVTDFEKAYESLIVEKQAKALLEFLKQTAVLRSAIGVRREAFAAIRNLLEPGSRSNESASSLRVRFGADARVEAVQATLEAFAILYAQIAELMQISTSQHPLVVHRIERGSCWYDFLGYPKVIAFVTKMLEKTITFVHRNYTKEGKLSNLPKAVQAIEEVLELRNSLKSEGIDVQRVDGQLGAAAVKIAGQLNKLVGGATSIQVNNTDYELREAIESRLLEQQRETPLLEDHSKRSDQQNG